MQSGTSSDANTLQLTGVTASNLIVLYYKCEGTIGTPTVSDGTSSLVVRAVNSHANGDLHGFFAYLLSANSGTRTYTVTPGGSPGFQRMIAFELSYTGGTLSFDTDRADGKGTSASPSSGNITTTGTDEIVFGSYGEYSDHILSARQINGQNADANVDAGGFTSVWRKSFGSTFTGAATATLSPSAEWISNVIAFKVTGAGGSVDPGIIHGSATIIGNPFYSFG